EGYCGPGTNVVSGTPCVDGNVCNGAETCNTSGVCVQGTPTGCTSGDLDGDDIPDQWELERGLSPGITNGFEDADGDGYPNVFEYALGQTDPNNAAVHPDRAAYPNAIYRVDGTGAGTHTTIRAALDAANAHPENAYQIIEIAPGVYKGDNNLLVETT